MPPHKTYVEACMGSAEVFLRKKPVEREIINDYNANCGPQRPLVRWPAATVRPGGQG